MIVNKLLVSTCTLLMSGSILLVGGAIGKNYDKYTFCLFDIIIIFGFLFILVGIIMQILLFIKKDK